VIEQRIKIEKSLLNFKLDSRLANDCFILGEINSNLVLLLNNSLVPWFILVPKTSEIEIIDLPQQQQNLIQDSIGLLATFVKNHFKISKLNIATIGNIVSQLHIHVVGREPGDYCWPNVVWGTTEREEYEQQTIDGIIEALVLQLESKFKVLEHTNSIEIS